MPSDPLPPPEAVRDILVWHQGALGDLLLAGPALASVSRHYPEARFTSLGHPGRWRLFARSLPMAAVWDGNAAVWSQLFTDTPLSPGIQSRLAPFQLALVFSPRPNPDLWARLRQAGIARVAWIPAFPDEEGPAPEPVGRLQARHLAAMGIQEAPGDFRLQSPESGDEPLLLPELRHPGPWLAVAPGSGHPAKNWPLAHFCEVTRALAWEHRLKVAWLTGTAEAALLPYLSGLAAAQGHVLLPDLPLEVVAAALAKSRLYIGGDTGLTHLAAAVGGPAVLALFGPTDPRIWAPQGKQVRLLCAPCPEAPCARGREIACAEPRCLLELSPAPVIEAAGALLSEV